MRRYTAILAILMIASLMIAGCSGKTDNATGDGVRGVEKAEVKIGFLGPLTGGAATIGVLVKDAVALAEEKINKENLIPGKKITIIYEDDQCDPKLSTTAMTKLVAVDKVAAIIGGLCSGPTLADAPIADQNKVLMLSYGATNPAIKDAGDYIFRNVPSDANQGVESAQLFKLLGAKKAAIIQIQNDWGVGLKNVFMEEAKRQGLEIVSIETYDPATTDFRTQVIKINAAKPDAIYMLSYPADAGLLLKQIREAGLDIPIVGADATKDDAVIKTAGTAAEGLILTLPGIPDSPELRSFVSAYKTAYGKDYTSYTSEGYDATMIIAKACAATDCTSTAMKDYLYKMGPYKGASGTYSFDKDGEVKKSYDYFTVKDGKWAPYTRSKASTEQWEKPMSEPTG